MKTLNFLLIFLLLIAVLVSCADVPAEQTSYIEQTPHQEQTTLAEQTAQSTETSTIEQTTEETPVMTETTIYRGKEFKTDYTVYTQNEDGVCMDVSIEGYSIAPDGGISYLINGEDFYIVVKVTNLSPNTIYQLSPYYCHGAQHAHIHEITVQFLDEKNRTIKPTYIHDTCMPAHMLWNIDPGDAYAWTIPMEATVDIGEKGYGEIFGNVIFAYSYTDDGYETKNDCKIESNFSMMIYELTTNK